MRQRNLNVLYLIDELAHMGGTEKHLHQLAEGMSKRGHQVTVASLAGGAYGESFREIPGVDYLVLGVKRIYDRQGLAALYFLRKLLLDRQVNVLQTFHTGSDLMGPLSALGLGIPLKVFSSRRDLGYTKARRHVLAQRLVNRLVNGIFANSLAVRNAVHELEEYPVNRIWVIYNGIDVARCNTVNSTIRSELLNKSRLTGEAVVVGSLGNIRPVKGFNILVEASGLLLNQVPNMRFLHAGSGDRNDLELRCRELGISEHFRFMGVVQAIPEFLSLLDIYVQPSYSEGFSNAILEAMAAGLPVVATAVGGNIEIIEQGVTGFLVEPGDAAGIAKYLSLLTENAALRREIGENGRRLVKEQHAFEGMVQKYEQVYYSNLYST